MTNNQLDHNDSGEQHNDPTPSTVQTHGPSVIWDPTPDKGGLTFSSMANAKYVIHTTETKGLPSYPYPPHVTTDPNNPDKIWQHVTGDRGAYALKSASPTSPNYEAGAVYQVEHIAYAADTPSQGDTFYESVARECVWFHRNKGVPLIFVPVWEDGSGYGEWSGRMSQAEFSEFSGICGHQHVPSPNAHWDPGRLDIPRLKDAIDKWLDETNPEEEGTDMLLVEGASGNAVKSLQRAMNNYSEANNKGYRVEVDGTWGKGGEMTDHLKAFQKSLNLDQTGTLDGLTASYLVGRYDPPNI